MLGQRRLMIVCNQVIAKRVFYPVDLLHCLLPPRLELLLEGGLAFFTRGSTSELTAELAVSTCGKEHEWTGKSVAYFRVRSSIDQPWFLITVRSLLLTRDSVVLDLPLPSGNRSKYTLTCDRLAVYSSIVQTWPKDSFCWERWSPPSYQSSRVVTHVWRQPVWIKSAGCISHLHTGLPLPITILLFSSLQPRCTHHIVNVPHRIPVLQTQFTRCIQSQAIGQ